MRLFSSRWFQRYARKQGINDASLWTAIERANRGQVDADLGREVIKQRIARPGEGRSKGYRTIILFRRGDRAFLVYGFAKSDRANISGDELRTYQSAAQWVLNLTESQLADLLSRGDFVEVQAHEQKVSQ